MKEACSLLVMAKGSALLLQETLQECLQRENGSEQTKDESDQSSWDVLSDLGLSTIDGQSALSILQLRTDIIRSPWVSALKVSKKIKYCKVSKFLFFKKKRINFLNSYLSNTVYFCSYINCTILLAVIIGMDRVVLVCLKIITDKTTLYIWWLAYLSANVSSWT